MAWLCTVLDKKIGQDRFDISESRKDQRSELLEVQSANPLYFSSQTPHIAGILRLPCQRRCLVLLKLGMDLLGLKKSHLH